MLAYSSNNYLSIYKAMRSYLTFWHKKKKPLEKELTSDDIHKLLIDSDFLSSTSQLHCYLNSEQFVFGHTFTAGKFTLWHVLASINKPEHTQLLKRVLTRFQDKVTPNLLNLPDAGGMTPCHYAAYFANPDALILFIEHGANPTLPNQHNETPLDIARRHHYANKAELLKITKIIENYSQIYAGAAGGNNEKAEISTIAKKRSKSLFHRHKQDSSIELIETQPSTSCIAGHLKPF